MPGQLGQGAPPGLGGIHGKGPRGPRQHVPKGQAVAASRGVRVFGDATLTMTLPDGTVSTFSRSGVGRWSVDWPNTPGATVTADTDIDMEVDQ